MDQSTPKGNTPPAVEGVDGKRRWIAPVLKRLDAVLTSAMDDSTTKPFDGGPAGGHQHS
jgi:hypothetical protein